MQGHIYVLDVMRTSSEQLWCTGRYDYIVLSYARIQQTDPASPFVYVLSMKMRANNRPLTRYIFLTRQFRLVISPYILCTVRSTCHLEGANCEPQCLVPSVPTAKSTAKCVLTRGLQTSNCIHKLQLQFVKNLTGRHSPLDTFTHSSLHVYPRFKTILEKTLYEK